MTSNFYQILELIPPSNQEEIRRAYHSLALRWHPDKNKAPESHDMFKKINEAYHVLSIPDNKDIYDKSLGITPQVIVPVNDVIIINLDVTLQDLYTGGHIYKKFERNSLCSECGGNTHECRICHGKSIIKDYDVVMVDVSRSEYMEEQLFRCVGNIRLLDHTRGDVLVKLYKQYMYLDEFKIGPVKVNNTWLSNCDVLAHMKISLPEALCGFTKVIKLPSGNDFVFESYDTIKDGDLYVIDNEGLYYGGGGGGTHGKVYVQVNVESMSPLTPIQRKQLWEILTGKPYTNRKFVLQKNLFKVC
jgi:DnaJ-class molecular chaperone